MHLRKHCFRSLSRQMDDAMDEVMTESLVPCLATLEAYLQASSPTNDHHSSTEALPTPPIQKKQKKEPSTMTIQGLDVTLFDRQHYSHFRQDPLLLPVVLVQGPSFGTDRRAQFTCLENCFKKYHPSSATIHLELPAQRQFNAMQELVRRCHCLSPVLSFGGMHRKIVRRKRKKVCFYSDLLLLWASLCEFKEIVISSLIMCQADVAKRPLHRALALEASTINLYGLHNAICIATKHFMILLCNGREIYDRNTRQKSV